MGLTFIHALFFSNLQQKNLAETAEGAPSLLFCFLWGTSFQKCLPFLEDGIEIDTTGYTDKVSMYLRRCRTLFSFRLRVVYVERAFVEERSLWGWCFTVNTGVQACESLHTHLKTLGDSLEHSLLEYSIFRGGKSRYPGAFSSAQFKELFSGHICIP